MLPFSAFVRAYVRASIRAFIRRTFDLTASPYILFIWMHNILMIDMIDMMIQMISGKSQNLGIDTCVPSEPTIIYDET